MVSRMEAGPGCGTAVAGVAKAGVNSESDAAHPSLLLDEQSYFAGSPLRLRPSDFSNEAARWSASGPLKCILFYALLP